MRVFPARDNSIMASRITFVPTGSRPLMGSSRIRISGSCRRVWMNWTFCCMPFESSFAFFLCQPSKPSFSSHGIMRRFDSAGLIPLSSAMNTSNSSTIIFWYRPRSSGM